jgi:hypothetical protein
MGLETEYVEYGIQLSLSMIGVTIAYFIQFSRPETFLALGLIPVLYGYTAYISNEGFSRSSLMSLPALIFVVTGGITALIAVFYSIGNVLVSVFSHGTQFKDFYGSTTLPLLVIGLLTGLSVFAYGSMVPGFQEDVAEELGGEVGKFSAEIVNETGLIQSQERAQFRMVNNTADIVSRLTLQKVSEDKQMQFNFNYREETRDNITREVYRRTRKEYSSNYGELSRELENAATDHIQRLNLLLAVPIITGIFYIFQPLLGILTGIFGKISLLLDS